MEEKVRDEAGIREFRQDLNKLATASLYRPASPLLGEPDSFRTFDRTTYSLGCSRCSALNLAGACKATGESRMPLGRTLYVVPSGILHETLTISTASKARRVLTIGPFQEEKTFIGVEEVVVIRVRVQVAHSSRERDVRRSSGFKSLLLVLEPFPRLVMHLPVFIAYYTYHNVRNRARI